MRRADHGLELVCVRGTQQETVGTA